MSKYIWILFIFSSISVADPFYGEKLARENPTFSADTEIAMNTENLTACNISLPQISRYLPAKLTQLKFIGVLKKEDKYKAILMDAQKQLFDLQVNDWLADELIQIIDIDLKSIRYINWRTEKNCESPTPVILKL
ncbi:hypothetical protein [Actinobacillus pleuropneumoniae]|uniref:PilP n=2 Tax=Actinobacillus pleuropneumoniae TaxID=715 RepID=A0A3S4XZT0_ACTPL|nr:hypothetical protein [Actinobacillus pleuropneumoniae]AYN80566.1 PilP [Actinobacillus pleuropneumoniae serovar 2 str. 4226]EFL79637.1 hypothetical protein APP2_0349 [Actinobacillus pleuropneumoniae serovar 2 str. 4226]EFM88476.1 hypothetical protein appser2_1860 [Actinobacillus pleuropneumoniae serovar 2 str. S1536]MEE3618866.1 hypothetical protein [Actinobacillus pleuropneumoniae]UKH08522.1 hypothetical protein KZH40_01055 [Actinobacillus pleuropneumoniae]